MPDYLLDSSRSCTSASGASGRRAGRVSWHGAVASSRAIAAMSAFTIRSMRCPESARLMGRRGWEEGEGLGCAFRLYQEEEIC